MRKYFVAICWLVIALLFISFLGFRKTYFNLFPAFTGTSWVIHFHVASILSWLALLFTQAFLAKSGRLELHQKIGKLSYILVPVILTGFILVTNHGQLKHKEPGLVAATFFDGSLFVLFYLLAILNRKNVNYHAPYMMLSAVPFINPGLGRFISPEVSLPIEFLLILTLLLTAYFKKKTFRPYLVALGSFIGLLLIVVYVSLINPKIIELIWTAIWG
ncbi:hypothetical protein [Lacibacter sediminis]|uniref:DUF2306 domain-containing protein n=1 Tax=Lacibacter sediminis TaxID=2760713 RepID=A0A7G5XIX9_9BACT|nr:hypothetical protein [Lacibacter sediminis]QNA45432.1 hypothetical protein H4075_04310 [Lacibacter sediminis]